MIEIKLDSTQIEDMIAAVAERVIARQQEQTSVIGLPLTLSKKQVEEHLGIGATKVQELFNRTDFPVIREYGHPKVPTHLLIKWIEQHTTWIEGQSTKKHLPKSHIQNTKAKRRAT